MVYQILILPRNQKCLTICTRATLSGGDSGVNCESARTFGKKGKRDSWKTKVVYSFLVHHKGILLLESQPISSRATGLSSPNLLGI